MRRSKRVLSLVLAVLMTVGTVDTALAGSAGAGGGDTGGGGHFSGGQATAATENNFSFGSVVYLSNFGKYFVAPTSPVSKDDLQNGVTHFQRVYSEGKILEPAGRIMETGRFFCNGNIDANGSGIAEIVYFDPFSGTYQIITGDRINRPIQVNITGTVEQEIVGPSLPVSIPLAHGQPVADKMTQTFGDPGGKLTSLMEAITRAYETFHPSGPGGSSDGDSDGGEVSVDASALTTEERTMVVLGTDEVKEQLSHYIKWWTAVYNDLGTVEADVKTPEELESEFIMATDKAKDFREHYGSAGSTDLGEGNAYLAMQPDIDKYPCVGIDFLTYRHGVTARPFAMNWLWLRSHAYTSGMGGNYNWFMEGWGSVHSFNNLWTSGGRGQRVARCAGYMYANEIVKGHNVIDPSGGQGNENSGYLFYGYYGALLLATVDTPETPPPPPDNPPPPDPVTEDADDLGTYYLMDYELNHVFDSMAEHYQDSTTHDHARLNPNIDTTDPSQYSDCGHGRNDYSTTTYTEVTYGETPGDGKSVDMDNAGPTKLFLHNNGVKGNTWWTRDQIRAEQTIDSGSVGDYVIDYGFNLLRKHFDDARAYSKIIAQDVSKDYLEQTLGMYEAIITTSPAAASAIRDSAATVGPVAGIKDNLSWKAVYKQTGSSNRYYTQSASHTYYCGSDDCSGHTCNYNTSHTDGGIKAFSVHGGTPSTYSVRLISIAHKYRTNTIPTGYAQPKDIVPFDYRPTTNGDGTNDDNQYRGSNTIDPGTEVTYVPEVPMIADEVPGPELEHHPKKVTTVGEESRKSKLILMTLYRVTGASTPVKGVVYSDTAVGGDAGLSSQTNSRLLALTAGGDFTVKADTNMQVNLYGYALDLIEPGDAGYDTVTLGNDVKAGWGNSGSRNKLMETYQTWAAAMLNPKNYQADFEMTIGTKKYNSFSATIGGFSSKASQSTETGQYNIHVKHGKIQEDAGYNAFISQLASDYGCSEGEAKTLFANSDMASAIIKAIEHDNSAVNHSNPAKYALASGEVGTFNEPDLATQVGGIGNANHWYDEEVRVFVIRRFMTPAAKVTNIIAQDKMDIGTSMEGLGGDTMGKFNLNVWFRDSCYTRAVTEYWPSTNGSDNKSQAISDGGLIIAGVYVNGADFNITNATTATGKH